MASALMIREISLATIVCSASPTSLAGCLAEQALSITRPTTRNFTPGQLIGRDAEHAIFKKNAPAFFQRLDLPLADLIAESTQRRVGSAIADQPQKKAEQAEH